MRDLIFISHANPEDNEFSRWLTLRLASLDYPAWCDVTELLGGERFWDNIEEIIRNRSVKFLFVLSKDSNNKQGPKNELHVAQAVQSKHELEDFIIPLKIDDLPYEEMSIQINPLNAINFTNNWAEGLETLIKKLEKDGVSKSSEFGANVVSEWWKNTYNPGISLEEEKEEYLSNEFEILSLPDEIFFHKIDDRNIYHILNQDIFPYPFRQHRNYILSFANPEVIQGHAKIHTLIGSSMPLSVKELLDGKYNSLIDKYEFNKIMTGFLSVALEKYSIKKGLKVYYLSGKNPCLYFHPEVDKQINFVGLKGKNTYRFMYSYSEANDYYWHFGINFNPVLFPESTVNILPTVLFSDDGDKIWDSTSRLHRKRRTHCKRWYNKEWGDRVKAAMHWLADDNEEVKVPLSSNHEFVLSKEPRSFISPVKYQEPN